MTIITIIITSIITIVITVIFVIVIIVIITTIIIIPIIKDFLERTERCEQTFRLQNLLLMRPCAPVRSWPRAQCFSSEATYRMDPHLWLFGAAMVTTMMMRVCDDVLMRVVSVLSVSTNDFRQIDHGDDDLIFGLILQWYIVMIIILGNLMLI